MMIKVIAYFLGVLNRGTYVYTLIKIIIVLSGKKGRDTLLNGLKEIDRNFKFV